MQIKLLRDSDNQVVNRSLPQLLPSLFLFSLVLTGCGGSSSGTDVQPQNDESLRELNVSFSTPERLQQLGIALSTTITAGGAEQAMQPAGKGYEATLLLHGSQQLQVYVGISSTEDGLLLASAAATAWLADTSTTISIPVQNFQYDFDQDGDGTSNLLEIERGTSPTNADAGIASDADNDGVPDNLDAFPNDPYETSDADGDGIGDNNDQDDNNNGIRDYREGSQIVVAYVDNADISIDGIWTNYWDDAKQTYYDEWGKATDSDSFGNSIMLENIMIDNTGRYNVNDQYYYNDNSTYAEIMHDGEYLYLKVEVYGEQLENWFNDSIDAWQDDSLELYFDVGYDHQEAYGADDYQRIFRFRDTVGDPTIDGPYSAAGMQSDYVTSYRYENSASEVWQQTYEIRISLASIGLKPGDTFGFEMAFNDDDDGGDRDYKWGWWTPMWTDNAWLHPNLFGKAKLQPAD